MREVSHIRDDNLGRQKVGGSSHIKYQKHIAKRKASITLEAFP